MASSSSAAAYQFDAYEAPKKQKAPAIRAVESSRKASTVAFTPGMLLSFVVVVTLVSVMVLNQVRLSEISDEINTVSAELETLESDYVKLSAELDSIVNLRTVEELAKTQLGMQRLDPHQVEPIDLVQEDTIVLTENSPSVSLGEKIKTTVLAVIADVQAYIGDR